MEIKKIAKIIWKFFGLIYGIINLIFSIAISVLILSSINESALDPELLLIMFPFLGVATGYWIWKGNYNWWRLGIISFSLSVTIAVLFATIFIAPKLNDLKQKKYEQMQIENLSQKNLLKKDQQKKVFNGSEK